MCLRRKTPGPHQGTASELYRRLRLTLLGNVLAQYNATGYFWERYDDVTGQGAGNHPFTGWTALVALVAADSY